MFSVYIVAPSELLWMHIPASLGGPAIDERFKGSSGGLHSSSHGHRNIVYVDPD